jgi:hypothetical protein
MNMTRNPNIDTKNKDEIPDEKYLSTRLIRSSLIIILSLSTIFLSSCQPFTALRIIRASENI